MGNIYLAEGGLKILGKQEAEQQKPRVHWSMLNMLGRCGEQFRRRYVLGEIVPPGVAIVTGKTAHTVAEKELTYKVLNEGQLMSGEEVKDTARDAFTHHWEEGGVKLDPDEAEKGIEAVKGAAADQAIQLATLYHVKLAPVINPLDKERIEWAWIIEMEGFPFDLAGTMDVVEPGGFRDLKTAAKTPSQADIDRSDQYTMYAIAHQVILGNVPTIHQDTLVKIKTPKVVTLPTTRDQTHFDVLTQRLEVFALAHEKGVFIPTNQDTWQCSLKYCGYARTCRYYNGHKLFAPGGKEL